jgi:hypothetical protein
MGVAIQWLCWAVAAYLFYRLWLIANGGYPIYLYIVAILLLFGIVKAGNSIRHLFNRAATMHE